MKGKSLFTAAGIAAGLMYLFDPDAGKRRRALVRDKMTHGVNVLEHAMGVTSRDMRNRARGLTSEMKHIMSREQVSDEVLVQRVRSQLGGVVSHPGSIDVQAVDGNVILSGVILTHELDGLLARVESVRGVKSVEHHMEVYDEPGNVPGLQGEPARRLSGGQFELFQKNWSPTARFLAGMAGGALTMYGRGVRGFMGKTVTTAGLSLLTRALTNTELSRIFGIGSEKGAVHVQKTITVNAPVETVFETVSHVESFPTFMKNVKSVSRLEGDRYHWTVAGPGGTAVEWDSVFTSVIPNKELAWRSEPGSSVQHEGVVRLTSNPEGSTMVDVRFAYSPVAGKIGHAVSSMLGANPKTMLDEDLLRMKTFIETGIAPHDASAQENL